VVDVVRTLIPTYGARVVFIHQEIWQAGSLQQFSPTVEEWNLRSEPWTFVVDGQGIIRAKFEGLTTRRELEAALKHMLGLE
jgi:peroxiredoxin